MDSEFIFGTTSATEFILFGATTAEFIFGAAFIEFILFGVTSSQFFVIFDIEFVIRATAEFILATAVVLAVVLHAAEFQFTSSRRINPIGSAAVLLRLRGLR